MPKLAPGQVPLLPPAAPVRSGNRHLSGRDVLLGAHSTPESRDRYNRAIAEWVANGRQFRVAPAAATVLMVAGAYWTDCLEYYSRDGSGGERQSIKLAPGFLRRLYGGECDRGRGLRPLEAEGGSPRNDRRRVVPDVRQRAGLARPPDVRLGRRERVGAGVTVDTRFRRSPGSGRASARRGRANRFGRCRRRSSR